MAGLPTGPTVPDLSQLSQPQDQFIVVEHVQPNGTTQRVKYKCVAAQMISQDVVNVIADTVIAKLLAHIAALQGGAQTMNATPPEAAQAEPEEAPAAT